MSRNPTQADYNLVKNTFEECFKEQQKEGRLSSQILSSDSVNAPEEENEKLCDTEALANQRALTLNHKEMNRV